MKHLRTTLKFAVAVAALLTVATGIMACTGQNGDSWLEKIGIHTEPGDTVPPTIQVFPMQANVGETPDFMKNVVASDSCSSVTIKVDSTTYNINAAGDYMVTYTATDSAGNVATAQAPLKVIDENTKIIYLTFDDGPSNKDYLSHLRRRPIEQHRPHPQDSGAGGCEGYILRHGSVQGPPALHQG